MKQHPVAFAVAYALIGAQALASIAAFVVIMFTPISPVAHKSDVNGNLGATSTKELVKEAEKNIAAQASQSGVTITSQKVTKITRPDGNTIDIYIALQTVEIGDLTLKVEFHKGIYSIANISQV